MCSRSPTTHTPPPPPFLPSLPFSTHTTLLFYIYVHHSPHPAILSANLRRIPAPLPRWSLLLPCRFRSHFRIPHLPILLHWIPCMQLHPVFPYALHRNTSEDATLHMHKQRIQIQSTGQKDREGGSERGVADGFLFRKR